MAAFATSELAQQLTISNPVRDQKTQAWACFIQGQDHGKLSVSLSKKAMVTPFGITSYGDKAALTLSVSQNETDLRVFANTRPAYTQSRLGTSPNTVQISTGQSGDSCRVAKAIHSSWQAWVYGHSLVKSQCRSIFLENAGSDNHWCFGHTEALPSCLHCEPGESVGYARHRWVWGYN